MILAGRRISDTYNSRVGDEWCCLLLFWTHVMRAFMRVQGHDHGYVVYYARILTTSVCVTCVRVSTVEGTEKQKRR